MVINLVIVKVGEQDIPGLTDTKLPRRLGPKRAQKIRKLYGAGSDVDVRKLVVRRPISKGEGKKACFKSPKIQRLVTDVRLRRKKLYIAGKKAKLERQKVLFAKYKKERVEYYR